MSAETEVGPSMASGSQVYSRKLGRHAHGPVREEDAGQIHQREVVAGEAPQRMGVGRDAGEDVGEADGAEGPEHGHDAERESRRHPPG